MNPTSSVFNRKLRSPEAAAYVGLSASTLAKMRLHGSFPAMVALMRDVITGEPTGVHRTALMDDGSSKRIMPDDMPAKRMLGRAKGAVVMLHHAAPRMGIAEGIETALSAQKLFDMPVWACLSDGGIAGFPIINCLEHLTFCRPRYAGT
jgi:putative DNA primase/helicase